MEWLVLKCTLPRYKVSVWSIKGQGHEPKFKNKLLHHTELWANQGYRPKEIGHVTKNMLRNRYE